MVTYVRKQLNRLVNAIAIMLLAGLASAEVPRTPWGVPDLNGVWKFSSSTPLERDVSMAGRSHYSQSEATAHLASTETRVEGLAAEFDGGKDKFVGLELWIGLDTPMTQDLRTSLIYEPADGKIPYTAAGLQRLAAGGHFGAPAGPEDRPLPERCIIGFNTGPPMDTTFAYNDNVQLFISQDTVVIMTEMVNDARIVPLDGRAHLPEQIRQFRGDSRGYWEGDTLVVETRNLTDETAYMGSGRNMQVIERFTLVSAELLEYDFRVDDPEYFQTPWVARTDLRKSNDPLYEYACHEHNRSMEYMLSGARAQEAAAGVDDG